MIRVPRSAPVAGSARGTTASTSVARLEDADEELLADVARRYYLADASKVQIACDLGLSRFKVARLLATARARGIVQFSIAVSSPIDQELSADLARILGLRAAVVVSTPAGELAARQQVATAAARILPGLVWEGALLGLAWSRAIASMVNGLGELPRCTALQLSGSLPTPAGDASTNDLVQQVARLAGGVAHQVHAPLVVDDAAVASALLRQPGIRDTLRLADRLDVSVVAVGAWRAGCSTVWEAVDATVREAGTRVGAVAEVSGRLLSPDGAAVVSPLDELVVGASLEQLARPAERLALISGPHRAQAAVAAVRAGLVTTLVTTAEIAREIVDADLGA